MSRVSIRTLAGSILTIFIASVLTACGGAATPQAVQSLRSNDSTASQDASPQPTAGPAPTPMIERRLPTQPPVKLPVTSVATEHTKAPSADPAAAAMPAPAPLVPFAAFAFTQAPPGRDAAGNTVYYYANNTIDGYLDTAWRVPGNGIGERVIVFFDQAVRLSEVWIVPGYAKVDPVSGENRFWQNRRVRKVRLTFGGGRWVEARLAEQAEFQPVRFEPVLTSYVEVMVLETTTPGAQNGSP